MCGVVMGVLRARRRDEEEDDTARWPKLAKAAVTVAVTTVGRNTHTQTG